MEGYVGIIVLICWPLIGAILGLIPRNKESKNDWFYTALFVELVAEVVIFIRYIKFGTLVLDIPKVFGTGAYFEMDGFRAIFSLLVVVMWLMSMLFAKEYFKKDLKESRFQFFSMLVFTATLGMILSDNLFTTFVFFEIMSLASYPWVAHYGDKKSMDAAASYLMYAVVGGLVTLVGLLILFYKTGTLGYDGLREICVGQTNSVKMDLLFVPSMLFIFGFAAKAGVFPLHTWLAKSYQAAPEPATSLLSTVLSKAGIIGIVVICANVMMGSYGFGMTILILGLITMLAGGLLALFSVDMKRIIAYSSMSQIGYIVVGLGAGVILSDSNVTASRGAFLHMINHSVFKMGFFIIIGIIVMDIGKNLDLNRIQGWGHDKWFLKIVFAILGLGISGVPMFSGYVSKTFIHEGLVEYAELLKTGVSFGGADSYALARILEILFLVGGGCTLAYMLKIFIPVFVMKPVIDTEAVEKKSEDKSDKTNSVIKGVSNTTSIILIVLALFTVVCGAIPELTMGWIGNKGINFFNGVTINNFNYFSLENLKGAGISLLIGLVLYFITSRIKKNYSPEWFGIEKMLYRPVLCVILPAMGIFFMRILDWCVEAPVYLFRKTFLRDNKVESREISIPARVVTIKNTMSLITKSVSFGLLMFCLGFLAVLVYLLVMMFN